MGDWDFDTLWSNGKGTSAILFIIFIGWQSLNKLEINPLDSKYF
jgi:hypothetical protein